jgi:hypothetical protein
MRLASSRDKVQRGKDTHYPVPEDVDVSKGAGKTMRADGLFIHAHSIPGTGESVFLSHRIVINIVVVSKYAGRHRYASAAVCPRLCNSISETDDNFCGLLFQ